MAESERDNDVTYIHDPSKDTTPKSAHDRATAKLTEYMAGYRPAGEILLELFDLLSFRLFNFMEQDVPEMRGQWVEYVYEKYCSKIPWEFKLGIENGTLLDSLLVDSVWCKAHPGFKHRVTMYRKHLVEEQTKVQPTIKPLPEDAI